MYCNMDDIKRQNLKTARRNLALQSDNLDDLSSNQNGEIVMWGEIHTNQLTHNPKNEQSNSVKPSSSTTDDAKNCFAAS